MPPTREGKGLPPMESTLLPTLTDSGLVTMTEVLWKTLTRTTGPYFLALETKMTQSSLLALGDVNIIITTQQEGQGWRHGGIWSGRGWSGLECLDFSAGPEGSACGPGPQFYTARVT